MFVMALKAEKQPAAWAMIVARQDAAKFTRAGAVLRFRP